MKNIVLNVKGMMCTGCENRVLNALSLIDGISDIKASHDENLVSFIMNEGVSLDEVKEAIDDLGFEVE